MMKVSECMTRDVCIVDPEQPVRMAAKAMAELDAGALPVGENDRLVGMITDRDIAIRAVAQGKGADCKIRDAMTPEIRYCFDDEEVEHVLETMGDNRIRRLPVLSRNKRLVGIVSIGDLSLDAPHRHLGQAVSRVSQPGGQHSQATH
jgi:CBS domain-containing protein